MRDKEPRKVLLEWVVRTYFDALAKGDFDMIPYDENVSLRAPLAPAGVHHPLVGKENLRNIWWAPLPSIVGGTRIYGIFFNEDLTVVADEPEIEVTNPKATLLVADRFTVNEAGKIVEQENHFDPRDVTNPGRNKPGVLQGR